MKNKKIDPRVAGSWLRRTGNETPASTSAGDVSSPAVASVPRTANQGWDPKEIWLQRIDLPRRDRAQNQS